MGLVGGLERAHVSRYFEILKIQTLGLTFCRHPIHVRDKYNINFYEYFVLNKGGSSQAAVETDRLA
jgi:hypothetical protein